MLKTFTSKKVRLNRPPRSPFALMSSRASSSVVVVCCESFRLPTIEDSAVFHHHGILRPGVSQRYREFHLVLGECIHLWDSVESGSVCTVVHMGMYVGCLVVPIPISDVIHL